jgi:pimeloyl-ACP methyl ester carboxylesterase
VSDRDFVRSGGSDIYFEWIGSGMPVLFLHAGIADSGMWNPQFETMVGYQLIRCDMRGFGQSPWLSEPFAYHDDALAVLDHLGVESAVVVGCSMGGMTALDLAAAHPDRVAGLVLIGTAMPGFEPEGGWQPWPLQEEPSQASKSGDLDRVIDIDIDNWVVGVRRDRTDVDSHLIEFVREMDTTPVATEEARESLEKPPDPDFDDNIAGVSVPTLAVVGEYDRPGMDQAAQHLAEFFGGQVSVTIAGAAHLPSLEQPESFNDVLDQYLAGLA